MEITFFSCIWTNFIHAMNYDVFIGFVFQGLEFPSRPGWPTEVGTRHKHFNFTDLQKTQLANRGWY